MDSWMTGLSAELFWDVSRKEVDPEQHERWLIERVMKYGRWEDWLLISSYYSKTRLLDLSSQLRLDPKSTHFLELYCSL